MTHLKFELDSSLGDLPVEVRSADLRVIERVVASRGLDVAPGDYLVSVRLVDGQQRLHHVKVSPGVSVKTVTFGVDDPDRARAKDSSARSPRSVFPFREMLAGSTRLWENLAGRNLPSGPTTLTVPRRWRWGADRADVLEGNVLTSQMRPVEPVALTRESDTLVPGYESPRFLSLGGSAWISLPAWSGVPCVVQRKGLRNLEVRVSHPQASLLLQFRARHLYADASTSLEGHDFTAERLLRDKLNDPIAATVGAYALLFFDQLERLHDWTRNLFDLYPTLPDAAVILAEHRSRLGDTRGAIAALLSLEQRGAPIFTEGIGLSVSRLRAFLRYETGQVEPAAVAGARRLLGELLAVSEQTDFGYSLTTVAKLPESSRGPSREPDITESASRSGSG